MMWLIILATFVAMAVGQFSNMNWNNNWNPYAFGVNVAGAAPVAYGQEQYPMNMMHNPVPVHQLTGLQQLQVPQQQLQQQVQVPQQQLQHIQVPQQQPQHVQVPQIQPRQVQVPQQKEQTEEISNGERLNREKRQLRAPLLRLNNPYYNRYQYPVPVWTNTNQRLTNAYPTIPQNYYQIPLRYPQHLNNYHYQNYYQIPLRYPQHLNNYHY